MSVICLSSFFQSLLCLSIRVYVCQNICHLAFPVCLSNFVLKNGQSIIQLAGTCLSSFWCLSIKFHVCYSFPYFCLFSFLQCSSSVFPLREWKVNTDVEIFILNILLVQTLRLGHNQAEEVGSTLITRIDITPILF